MKKIVTVFNVFLLCFSSKAQEIRDNMISLAQMATLDPVRYQRFMNLETFTTNFAANQNQPNQRLLNPNGVITIPVVVHVLHRGEAIGTGFNISVAQIQSQIDVLNKDFRRLNVDKINTPSQFSPVAADLGIEFKLACKDPNGNTTDGIVRKTTSKTFIPISNSQGGVDENVTGVKFSSTGGDDAWPTDKYLNIWVCVLVPLGYTTFPSDFAASPNVDGIVVRTTAFGTTGNVISPYNGGRTATHEIGHWLNLLHIWGEGICGNDFVNDTPVQQTYNFNCPTFPQVLPNCGTPYPGQMFMNYMDYTNDACMNIFTVGQKTRTRALFATGGPRAAALTNYFNIQAPTGSIYCPTIVKLTNPNCLTPTWSVVSGPATITAGQGTNACTLNPTAVGTIILQAISGNYISQVTISSRTDCAALCGDATPVGKATLCTSETYNTTNGAVATWTVLQSGNIVSAPSPATGVSTTLNKIGSGIVTLIANISTPCGIKQFTKTITVARADTIVTAQFGCSSGTQTWTLTADGSAGTNWSWSVGNLGTNSQITIYNPSSSSTIIAVKGAGAVKLNYTDLCGVAKTDGITVYSSCPPAFSVAPNPTPDEITISTDNSTTAKMASTISIYKIKITDQSGVTRKLFDYKTPIKSVKISTKGLGKGIYSISMYDGTIWSTQKLEVQ